jgi:hypothetical protein
MLGSGVDGTAWDTSGSGTGCAAGHDAVGSGTGEVSAEAISAVGAISASGSVSRGIDLTMGMGPDATLASSAAMAAAIASSLKTLAAASSDSRSFEGGV